MRKILLLASLVCAAVPLASRPVSAQSFTPVREQKNLSPAALARLHTLEELNQLPAGQWRFHPGDLPHGEAPTLDDSSWNLVSPDSKAPKEAVWYRRTIEVPRTLHGYDLTGARIWFQFRADANGPMPQIIYFNGRRVALGDDLEPIILFEPAHPGDKILVAVKLLHTVDDKRFSGVSLRIDPEPNATHPRPNPNDLRIQAITAANLLPELPTPRRDLLPTVEAAVAAIDMRALSAGNQAAFDASLRHAQAILAPLHPVLAQVRVTLAGNSHIDAAWLWPRSETIDVVRRTFTSALQLMDEYPGYTFSQSAAQYSAWIADKYPAMNEQIKQRIREGRWEIVGGMWVEPDLNLPGGESLVRQLLVGQRFFEKQYGVTARIGWNPDSFGYNWQLPQIYKRSGMDYFVTQKMHWNDTNQLPFRLFWWQSPDGSKVLTYFPTDYVHDNVNPTRISADVAESAARNPGTTAHLDLYGIGDHGGGPTRAMLEQADHWIAADLGVSATPEMHFGTAQQFFSSVETTLNASSPTWNYDSIAKGYTAPPANGPAIGIPTWKDELYFEYHRGVFTSQAAHKRNMRRSEAETLGTEELASLAWLYGQPYPADTLTDNWKKITFNQFHDLAAGSGIAVIYRDAQNDYTEVADANRRVTEPALRTLTAHIDTTAKEAQAAPVVAMNTMAWPRSDAFRMTVQLPLAGAEPMVVDSTGQRLLSQVMHVDAATGTFDLLVQAHQLPAVGYQVLHVEPQREVRRSTPSDLHLEETPASFKLGNHLISFTVDKKNGCLTHLTLADEQHGLAVPDFLAANGCGNQLQTYADNPRNYDAWNIDPGTLDGTMTPVDTVSAISVVEDGPLRKTIRITRNWRASRFTQDISLEAGADTVRVATEVDWHETHTLLKAAFPLAATSAKATYEIPFGSIERPTTRNNSFEKAQFEVPALQWADLGDEHQGVSILNDSKYGYDALGNTLRLTLLRSPTWPDPDADRGRQRFTYAIYPHAGTWKQAQTVHRAYELNTPLTALQVAPHTGSLPPAHSFAEVTNANVELTAIKKAEDANALVFRMYEWAGTPTDVHLRVPPGALYAVESNLMEKVDGPHLPLTEDVVTLPIKPFEIRTIQVFYPTSGQGSGDLRAGAPGLME